MRLSRGIPLLSFHIPERVSAPTPSLAFFVLVSIYSLNLDAIFQNLSSWKGKRISVRGEFVTTMEGAWISGRCKGGFVTNGYRWPVFLTYGEPAHYSTENAKLYATRWPPVPEGEEALEGRFSVVKTATFVGLLKMKSEYSAVCSEDGSYIAYGFGHLGAAAAELAVERVLNFDLSLPAGNDADDDLRRQGGAGPGHAEKAGLHAVFRLHGVRAILRRLEREYADRNFLVSHP